VASGLTVAFAPDSPVLHWYVAAPAAVRVEDAPAQIDGEEALTVTSGRGWTVTSTEAVFEQPSELVPVTKYSVVVAGETVMLGDVSPVLHVNCSAPWAVSVENAPAQISAGEALALTSGAGVTVTVMFAVPGQPVTVVPLNEYVVVDAGVTVTLAVVAPVFQR
jgi:hypothetical protein